MEQKIGIIYELRANIADEWHPFYVGQTGDPLRRIKEHRRDAKNATAESTLVYRNIKEHLNANDIEWDMFKVAEFTASDEGSWEDEHIVRLLLAGAKLWNSKKGSPNWLAERQSWADDMQKRGITNYKKYREVLTLEEHNRKIQEQNARRIAEEQRLQHLEEARRQENFEREQQRLKIKQDMAAAAERARIDREQREAAAKRKEAEREARWLALAPERAARLRVETARLEREETERQKRMAETEAKIQEREKLEKIIEEENLIKLMRAREKMIRNLMKK